MRISPTKAQAGFTLLELLVVLVILALTATAVLSFSQRSLESARVRGFLVQAEALMHEARNRAIESQSETAVVIDAEARQLTLDAANKSLAIPAAVTLDAKVAVPDGGDKPAVRFFPTGGSSGGKLAFGFRGRAYELRINWLTGRADAQGM